jgi:HK97 family phage major capsid protein
MSKIERLTEELKTHLKAAQSIAQVAEKDNDRDLTDAERAQVNDLFGKAKAAKDALHAAKADEQVKDAIRDLGDGIGLDESGETGAERGAKAARSGLIVPDNRKSIGKHFIESQAYKALLSQAPNGQFGEKMRVQSAPVGFKALVTGVSDTSGGALVDTDRRGLLVGPDPFFRPLSLRSLVTAGTTTSDQIEYARIAGWTNSAAPVAEATSSAVIDGTTVTATQGGLKPESGFSTVRVTTPVRTIAHWMPATKRALSDAAQIRTLIDNFLERGLEEELEDQMIAGDNIGENFEGLANVSGVQTQAADAGGLLHTLRKAKTKVRVGGRSVPNGYVLHPNDVERIDLLQDNEARFYFDGPSNSGSAGTLWGLPVVESEAIPAGTAYVGDWRKAILWDREQASVTVTDSHADFFVRNLVAILAEMRAAFGVIQPSAFVKVTL